VCGGYASLLEVMCRSVGIKCIIVEGYSKTKISDINKTFKNSDHGWNAVKLHENWYLVDVTWASGYLDSKTRKFVKNYNNSYFLTDPDFFYLKHFPKDKSLFLTENKVKMRNFKRSPIFHDGIIDDNIIEILPKRGIIKIRLKSPLTLKIKSNDHLSSFGISLNNNKKVYIPDVLFINDYYLVQQKFEKPGVYSMTIFANGHAIATYKLKIKKNWP